MTQTQANLGVTFRALCEQTLPLDLPWLLLVDEEQTLGVLTTFTLQELPTNVIDFDGVRPISAHDSAFDKGRRAVNNMSGSCCR